MSLDIRPASAADHAVWEPLWQAYLRFYNTELPEEVRATTWQRLLDPVEPMNAAIAWADGKAVGLVHWIFHRSCWSIEQSCYLQDLFVSADVRGAGVGRALIEHVCAQAKAAGSTRVHWLTQESNATARTLYDKVADCPGYIQYRKAL